jgi:hypothetical protein
VGISIMPSSAKSGEALHFIAVEDLHLIRTVRVYAVAGRERSAAANTLLKMLRCADWTRVFLAPESGRAAATLQ